MSKTLTTPIVIADNIIKINLTTLTIDTVRRQLHVGYQGLDSIDGEIVERLITIDDPHYATFLTAINLGELATASYAAMASQDPALATV